ncbi:hypothetical protein BDN70DRAFT_926545, partial [Pholiota conissans]
MIAQLRTRNLSQAMRAAVRVNNIYRNPVLGELYGHIIGLKNIIENLNSRKSPFVEFADGALAGLYQGTVFGGLMEAMVQKKRREERGMGTARHGMNLRMSSISAAHPPTEFYPRFPQQICDRTFQLAQDYLSQINYNGLCSLSCDDTKLFATFRLVSDPDDMKELLQNMKDKKAVKVRLWTLTIAVPKITPIIIAALPIHNDLDAETLAPLSHQILNGLITRQIKVISYTCDGTEVERAVQRLLT